jgi:hypothetical protein
MFDSATLCKEDSKRAAKKTSAESWRTSEYTGGGCLDCNIMPIRNAPDGTRRKTESTSGGCFDSNFIPLRDSSNAKKPLKKAERRAKK